MHMPHLWARSTPPFNGVLVHNSALQTSLLDFPDEVFEVIAAHVPVQQRLSSFSLVHSRFKAAADHATHAGTVLEHNFSNRSFCSFWLRRSDDSWEDRWRDLDCWGIRGYCADDRQIACEHFGSWLCHHAQHLTRLQLTDFNTGFSTMFSPLPPKLRELQLTGCAAVSHSPEELHCQCTFQSPVLVTAAALTKLELSLCTYNKWALSHIAEATQLQHLAFTVPDFEDQECMDGFQGYLKGLPENFLKSLNNLTHLELRPISSETGKNPLPINSVFGNTGQHLAGLAKLQTFILHYDKMSETLEAGLQGLQQTTALTRLDLAVETATSPYAKTPWLQHLTSLQDLALKRAHVDTQHLVGLTKISILNLDDVSLDAQHITDVLTRLTGLQQLHINQAQSSQSLAHINSSEWPMAGDAYTALSAGSMLQQLSLKDCQLPVGVSVWQHALAGGRTLPHLTTLVVSWSDPETRAALAPTGNDAMATNGLLTATDIAAIAGGCPRLQHVCIDVQLGVQLAPLQQLTQLTSLYISGVNDNNVLALASLTGLQQLVILRCNEDLSSQGLVALTALQQLTRFELCMSVEFHEKVKGRKGFANQPLRLTPQECRVLYCYWSRRPPSYYWVERPRKRGMYDDEVVAVKDVWQQLAEMCAADAVG